MQYSSCLINPKGFVRRGIGSYVKQSTIQEGKENALKVADIVTTNIWSIYRSAMHIILIA